MSPTKYSKTKGLLGLSASTLTLALTSSAMALPTTWNAHSPSQGRAKAVASTQAGGAKADILAEFPISRGNGYWQDANSVHVFPKIYRDKFQITELNGAGDLCPRMSKQLTQINTTEDKVQDILLTGLDMAANVAAELKKADNFKKDNQSVFEQIEAADLRIDALKQSIEAKQQIIDSADDQIKALESDLADLDADYQKLIVEAASGVPTGNPQITALNVERADLVKAIDKLDTQIALLEEMGIDATAKKNERKTKQDRVDAIDAQIAGIAGEYRAKKKAEADTVSAEMAEISAQIDGIDADLNTTKNDIRGLRIELSNALLDPAYLSAQATVSQYSAMLRSYTKLYSEFVEFREPVIEDAMLVINWSKANFNDLARIDAGFGTARAALLDPDVAALPGYIAAQTGMKAQLGIMQDVSFDAKDGVALNTPPVQFTAYQLSGGVVRPVPELKFGDETPEGLQGFTRVEIATDSKEVKRNVSGLPYWNWLGMPWYPTVETVKTTPQVSVYMGLGTYCGNIKAEEEHVQDVPATSDSRFGALVSKTRYTMQPHTKDSEGAFGANFEVSYSIEAMRQPSQARCDVHFDRFDDIKVKVKDTRWSIFGIISGGSYNKDVEAKLKQDLGIYCTFIETDDENSKALNQLALSDAFARFTMMVADKWKVTPPDQATLDAFGKQYPNYSWAPAMLTLCGGQPVCTVVVEALKASHLVMTDASGHTNINQKVNLTTNYEHATTEKITDQRIDGRISFKVSH